MPNQIELKRMRHVLEVAKTGSVTAAAGAMGITQSALSRSISDVEAELGVALFARLPRGVQLTDAGQRFVAGARRIIGELEQLVTGLRAPTAALTGHLRIAFAPGVYVTHGVTTIRDFTRLYANVSVEVATGSPQRMCPRLINGEFDVLVGSSSYLKRWREFELDYLAPMHAACMMRHGHPLTRMNRTPTEAEVLQYPFVLPRTVEARNTDIAQRFVAHGLPPLEPQYVVDDFRVAREIVQGTDAIYVLMSPDPDFAGTGKHVALLPGVLQLPEHHVVTAHPQGRPRSAAVRQFEAMLAERLATPPSSRAATPTDA